MTSDDVTGRWPAENLWPDDDAPPAEWARFYRDRMGWVVLPTASRRDVIAYTVSLVREATADYAADHGGDPPPDVAEALWDGAREIADATHGRPIGYIYNSWMKAVAVAADVTDAMISVAWEPLQGSRGPREEADTRGICILANRSARDLPMCLVDVDPRHGGDVEGRWGMSLPGPKASTPGGGVHTLMVATGKETVSADLGPGVDVVAGGGTIPVPAGSATPGRRWLRRDAPEVAPDDLRRRGRRRAPPRPGAVRAEREPGDDVDDDSGQVASMVGSEVHDDERNRTIPAIVGMLARPRACPPDFVRACLELLVEGTAGRDARRDEAQAEVDRWRLLLTRGPRDADFAAEVVEMFIHVRDRAARRMKRPPGAVARSVWKVCERREGGEAGAEDYGVGPVLAHAAPGLAPPGGPSPVVEVAPIDVPSEPAAVPYPPPSPEVAAAAVAASVAAPKPKWRGGIDPRTYVHGLGDIYTDDDLGRDLRRRPIRIDAVFPAVDFATCKPSNSIDLLTPPITHGWGPHLSQVLRGLSPGDFRVIGAGGAGAGKTWFVSWLTHGLAMQTAARLLGVPGYERAPLVMPVWATEMPKQSEVYFRAAAAHLGFDQACLADGEEAHDAPGVSVMAAVHRMTPHEVVAKARAMERTFGADPRFPFHFARYHVTKVLRPSDLPRRSRRAGVNVEHRAGPDLVDHLADAVEHYRAELAARAGVSEDQVLPLVMIDPAQRFAGDAESEKRAIDAFLQAVVDVLCREVGCAAIGTSDTTKGGSRQHNIETFLSKPAGELASDVLAGTFSIQHHADCLALCAEPPRTPTPEELARMSLEERLSSKARSLRCKVHVRVLKNRNGGIPATSFPYEWDMHLGRYRALDPEPLRAAPPAEHQQGAGGRRPFVPPPAMGHGGPKFTPAPRPSFADDLAD